MENKEIDEILNCVSNMNEEQNIAVRNEFVNIELDIQELDEFISKLGKDRDLDARNDQDHKTDHLKLEGNGEKHDESEYKNCANENEFYTEVADSQGSLCSYLLPLKNMISPLLAIAFPLDLLVCSTLPKVLEGRWMLCSFIYHGKIVTELFGNFIRLG
ncbi:hypothetical protein SK128_005927 [Halocaridina rubra]|uniref:Uncharacterized protein n=1 Tax=Halocaridina rubra TaxID=373956 RepID=A0AAN8ZTE7_HALRR